MGRGRGPRRGGRPMPPIGGRPGIRPPKPPRDTTEIYLPGRPPIGGRPLPPIGGGRPKPGRPLPPRVHPGRRGPDQFGPGRPMPPIGGGRPPSKPFPGRPIGDDQFPVGEDPIGLFPIPGRPPKKPPVERHPWGREDDPNYAKKKQDWHEKRRPQKPERTPGYGGRIGAPPGTGFTMDFRDSDRDGVDDRHQPGPGMPNPDRPSRGGRPMPPRRGGRGGREFLKQFFRSGRR